jgi:trehalose utilization protein
MIRVTVWNEYRHEQNSEEIRAIYPDGIHAQIAKFLHEETDFEVRTATLDEPECGLTQDVIDNTDVLLWWGHKAHNDVPDEIAQRVQEAVLKGMGMIFLHSAHHSKPFKRLMGTSCNLCWREDGDMERVWVVDPGHQITQGLGKYFEIEHEEMYGEPFGVPEPQKVVLMGWYEGGEVFRSGCCYIRENGKIFYFQPGHESYPTYYNKDVQKVIKNAIRWAVPVNRIEKLECPNVKKPGEE